MYSSLVLHHPRSERRTAPRNLEPRILFLRGRSSFSRNFTPPKITRYTVLYCTILYFTILYYTVLYYTILYYTLLYYTILYYTILYYIILYYTILYCIILYYTILYYTILYYTVLYCTIIYYTVYIQVSSLFPSERLEGSSYQSLVSSSGLPRRWREGRGEGRGGSYPTRIACWRSLVNLKEQRFQ